MPGQTLTMYQIDAFASKVFEGNPAAVVPLTEWLPDQLMQSIAEENNLAETAFYVPEGDGFRIRWFTPAKEVKLCGHATLASAFVLFEFGGWQAESIVFQSLSGPLTVQRSGELLEMDFPAQPGVPCSTPAEMVSALGVEPSACLASEDYLVILENEQQLRELKPNMSELEKLDLRGVAVSAPSDDSDFVVRFFAPKYGIPEDPVTGSAYTQLTPYWSERLDKQSLAARQISARGGDVFCSLQGERVKISGTAKLYLKGEIYL